jgi:hypothetical protein
MVSESMRWRRASSGLKDREKFTSKGLPGSFLRVEMTALGRQGQPHEIVAVVFWLASNEASYITGPVVTVDGGFTIKCRGCGGMVSPAPKFGRAQRDEPIGVVRSNRVSLGASPPRHR